MTTFLPAAVPALVDSGNVLEFTLQDVVGPAGSASRSVAFDVVGAEDIVALGSSAITRVVPMPGAVDVETTAAPFIEFNSADFPWRYSPSSSGNATPDPWLVLAVVANGGLERGDDGRSRLVLSADDRLMGDLPGRNGNLIKIDLLNDAGMFAHVQKRDADQAMEGALARVVGAKAMVADTDYLAALCIHPAAEKVPVRFADSGSAVSLRVLHSWRFRTHPDSGDARTLARQLRVVDVGDDPRIGAARVKYPLADSESLRMSGLFVPASRQSDPMLPVSINADLVARRPLDHDADGRVVLGLPDYGARWSDASNRWSGTLNADPRLRAAAGLGVRAARVLQEEIRTAARAQIGNLVLVQRLVHAARFGARVDQAMKNIAISGHVSEADALDTLGPHVDHIRAGRGSIASELEGTRLPGGALSHTATGVISGRALRSGEVRTALANRTPRPLIPADTNGSESRSAAEQIEALAAARAEAIDDVISFADLRASVTEVDGSDLRIARPDGLATLFDPARATRLTLPDFFAWFDNLPAEIAAPLDLIAAVRLALLEKGEPMSLARSSLLARYLDANVARKLALITATEAESFIDDKVGGTLSHQPLQVLLQSLDWPLFMSEMMRAVEDMLNAEVAQSSSARLMQFAILPIVRDLGNSVEKPSLLFVALAWAAILANLELLNDQFMEKLPPAVKPITLTAEPATVVPPGDTLQSPMDRQVDIIALKDALSAAVAGAGARTAGAALGDPATLPEAPYRASLGLDTPAWSYLRDHASEWMLPGRDLIPDHAIVVLRTNAPFIDAFMVGFNEGVISELLWHGIDIDRRSTPCRNFWDIETEEGWMPDITPLERWGDTPLGDPSHRAGVARIDYLTILLKTPLLRRYPSILIRLEVDQDRGGSKVVEPVIQGSMDADTHYVGFDISTEEASRGRLILEQSQADGGFSPIDDPWNDDFEPRAGADGATVAAALFRRRLRVVLELAPYIGAGR